MENTYDRRELTCTESVQGPVSLEIAAAAAPARQPATVDGRQAGSGARENFTVAVALAISDAASRERIHKLLLETDGEVKAQTAAAMTSAVELPTDQELALEWLQGYFVEGSPTPLILISDLLKPPTEMIDGFLTRECQARFAKHALGTIAIMQSRQRVLDIDRVIRPTIERNELARVMVLLIGRLQYLTAPQSGRSLTPDDIFIRPLRSDNEREFREYFKLRHRVYSRMGYLDPVTESSPSGLEMNEADVHSIHLGAFHRESPIGCARVVKNETANEKLIELLEKIASNDPISRDRLRQAYPLGLPIFQSHRGMTKRMVEIAEKGQKCGELSRVIVDRAYRGNHISELLITEALERAVREELECVFLECLEVHEKLYEKHGFKRIPGVEGNVTDVEHTMIAMELRPEEIANIKAKLD